MTDKTSVIIQAYGIEAAALTSELHRQCFAGQAGEGWSQTAIEDVCRRLPIKILIAQDHSRRPVGYLIGQRLGPDAEILSLGTLPSCRRRGISRTLLQYWCAECARFGVKSLALEVHVENDAALNLYRSEDFEVVGRRKDYYKKISGQSQDAYTLVYRSEYIAVNHK